MTEQEIKEHASRDTFGELKVELEPWKNTLVLNSLGFEVGLLLDVVDLIEDYYWVIQYPREDKPHYESCVGGWIPLKQYLPERTYGRIRSVWNLNYEPKAE